MSQVTEWLKVDALLENPEIKSRCLFAKRNCDYEPSRIVENYNHLTLDEMRRFLSFISNDMQLNLKGVGVDLGAGVGGVANVFLSLHPKIERIYGVEIVPDVVRLLQSKVTKHFGNEDRMVSVIGSFDDIKLPDNSVDFVVEYDSLHHSNDLDRTLREVSRILKPGGILIALDRVQPDWYSGSQRKFMLDAEYDERFKKEYGMPLEVRLTRRENGEHEIRESEWRASFRQAGLSVKEKYYYHRKSKRGVIFGLISQIPWKLRHKYRFYPMLVRFHYSFLLFYFLPFLPFLWNTRVRALNVQFNRREAFMSKTVFIVTKP